MSKFNLNLVIVAAAFIAASATASAQSALLASIPFDFKTGSQNVLPAGDYAILRENAGIWVFESRESRHKAMVALGTPSQSGNTDLPQLVFRCHESQCALNKIQVGHGETGYEVLQPKSKPGEQLATVVVPLSRGGAE